MNSKTFDRLFLLSGVVLQVIAYVLAPSSLLAFISGAAGVISVVLFSQRKLSAYFYGYIQLLTYVILCVQQHFYGEIVENIFYAVTMLYGIYNWKKNYDDDQVATRSLTPRGWAITLATMLTCIAALWTGLSFTNDTQPFMDSISTVPAFIAQVLMIIRFKENWFFWLIINVASIIMWVIAGDWCMVAQFVFWTANCLYGYMKWKE